MAQKKKKVNKIKLSDFTSFEEFDQWRKANLKKPSGSTLMIISKAAHDRWPQEYEAKYPKDFKRGSNIIKRIGKWMSGAGKKIEAVVRGFGAAIALPADIISMDWKRLSKDIPIVINANNKLIEGEIQQLQAIFDSSKHDDETSNTSWKDVTIKGKERQGNNNLKKTKSREGRSKFKLDKSLLNNDLSWYNNYPELIEGLIGPNFITAKDTLDTIINGTVNTTSIGLVANLPVDLCASFADDNILNTAMTKVYTAVRQANAGSTNGMTTLDYYAYITNIRAVIAAYSVSRWAYGTMNAYSNLDYHQPDDLFAAKGLDIITFRQNKANFRQYLLNVQARLKTFGIMNLDILKRTEWLFANTYKDSDDAKASKYVFQANRVPFFEPDEQEETGYNFTTTDLGQFSLGGSYTGLTYNNFIARFEHLLDALITEKFNIISGDIMKAYAGSEEFHINLPDIPENYTTPEGYNEEVLTQIQNSTLLGNVNETVGFINGYITTTAKMGVNESAWAKNANIRNTVHINMYKNNISNLDVIGASRFVVTAGDTVTNNSVTVNEYGSEVIGLIRFIYRNSASTNYRELDAAAGKLGGMTSDPNTILTTYALWSHFDWAPKISCSLAYYASSGATVQSYAIAGPLWDYNNYAKIAINYVQPYHNIALISLYDVTMRTSTRNNLVEVA